MIISADVSSQISRSIRSRQIESLFDVPPASDQSRSWSLDAPVDARPWSVGLVVGPSGAGKSTLLSQLAPLRTPQWSSKSLVDDFPTHLQLSAIVDSLSAVGLGTIPAWIRPYETLSAGERARADLASVICEAPRGSSVAVDEFSAVVDRQVAKILSYSVARYARSKGVQLILATCHNDVIEWLQPDWIIRPEYQSFEWRDVNDRPKLRGRSRPASIRNGANSLPIII